MVGRSENQIIYHKSLTLRSFADQTPTNQFGAIEVGSGTNHTMVDVCNSCCWPVEMKYSKVTIIVAYFRCRLIGV